MLLAAGLVVMMAAAIGCAAGLSPSVPAGQQRGMVLPTWEPHGYDTAQTPLALRQIADLGAGWVQLVPTWYEASSTATQIRPVGKSPDDNGIRDAVAQAHDLRLKVLLKPHVDVLDGTDRSDIQPGDRAAWFASYTTFISHYARLAAELDVDEFVVGTELDSMSPDRTGWAGVIQAVRDHYPGPLVYAANYNAYTKVSFWDLVDLVGIDAYWPLGTEPTTDVATLERHLVPIRDQLATFATSSGRRIVFTEAGFTSQRGATTAPSKWTISEQPAQDEQAAAYRALLHTFDQESWWAGVYWWVWADLPSEPRDPPPALNYSVRGKAAESVLRQWWSKKKTSNQAH